MIRCSVSTAPWSHNECKDLWSLPVSYNPDTNAVREVYAWGWEGWCSLNKTSRHLWFLALHIIWRCTVDVSAAIVMDAFAQLAPVLQMSLLPAKRHSIELGIACPSLGTCICSTSKQSSLVCLNSAAERGPSHTVLLLDPWAPAPRHTSKRTFDEWATAP